MISLSLESLYPSYLSVCLQDLTTLVHGDVRVDNMLFDLKTNKVNAILDWELSTLGHPGKANHLQIDT